MQRRPVKADDWGRHIDLGLQFAIAVAAGMGLGYFLDCKWHTTPFLLIAGLLLGATSGFLNIYRAVFPKNVKKHHQE